MEAHRRVSWAWVKAVRRAFGGGSGFCQAMSLTILKPKVWSAKPRLKIMWWVPLIQSVPSGLSTCRASRNQRTFQS